MAPLRNNQNIIFIIVSFCLILICSEGFAREGTDIAARKKLVTKYKNAVKTDLKFILLKENKTNEEWRDLLNIVAELYNDKSAKMTELLVDLIDFHIGEHTDQDIYEQISKRKKEMVIPLLKKKLLEKPSSFEKDLKERNEVIADLLRHIINNVKYVHDPSDFDSVDVLKSWLFQAQMELERYYYTNGIYPEKLTDAFVPVFEEKGAVVIIDGKDVRIEYKSFGATYFIGTAGEDGILGTKDDVTPPYLGEIYSFPRR